MFKPLGKMILIKRAPELSITEGGIIIPHTSQEKPMQGKVVALGDEVTRIKKDQRVLFALWSGTEINLEDGRYLIIAESDILGLIVPEEKKPSKLKIVKGADLRQID